MERLKRGLRTNTPVGLALVALDRAFVSIFSILAHRIISCAGPVQVDPRCRIIGGRFISVGAHFSSGRGLWLEAVTYYRGVEFMPTIKIGHHVGLGEWVHITAVQSVSIGDHTLIGSKVHVTDHNHGGYAGEQQSSPQMPPVRRPLVPLQTRIGKNVWLGDNVTVLAGSDIGDGAIIGANTVVSGQIPKGSIIIGARARQLKSFDESIRQWVRSTHEN